MGQPKSYRFKHFTTHDGLSQHNVICTIQDSKGFMWMGTANGLNRFDGYTFKNFFHNANDSTTISSNRIRTLFVDKKASLLIGTSNGLDKYNSLEEHFIHISLNGLYEDFSQTAVYDIKQDQEGKLWIGTENGLFVLDTLYKVVKHYSKNELSNHSLFEHSIGRILIDKDQKIWLGGQDYISKFDPVQNTFQHFLIKEKFRIDRDPRVNVMIQDSKDRIWFGSNQAGLSLFDPEKQEFNYYPLKSINENDVLHNRVRAIKEDDSGNLWLGTFDGLIIFDPDSDYEIKIVNDPNDTYSLNDNGINSIYEDNRGNYWIGVYFRGVNYMDKNFNVFKHYHHTGNDKGLIYNVVTSITEDRNKDIWIATDRQGLNHLNTQTQTFNYYKQENTALGSASNHIMEIEVGEQNNLWLGTLYGGLFSFDIGTKAYQAINFNESNLPDLSINRIRALEVDHKGNLWIAHSLGLHYYEISTGKTLKYTNEINGVNISNSINEIFEDDQKNIWIALNESNGLLKLENEGWEAKKYDIPSVNSIFQDENYIWLGTASNGLFRLDTKTEAIEIYNSPDLLNGNILGILSDNDKNLWISSTSGLYKFNKENGNFTSLNRESGLNKDDFKKNSYLKSSDGLLYFGGRNGMIVFNPEDIVEEVYAPNLELTSLTVISKKKNKLPFNPSIEKTIIDGGIKLPYHQNTLFIDFVAINYSQPEQTQYAYQLDGFDEWNYIGNNRKATYTNLDPGKYLLKFKATNSDGIWSSESQPITITIHSPFWKTWWAYTIYTLAILIFSYLIKTIISARIALKNELKLEHFKNEQEKKIHELKYRFFTNISHDLRTPLTLILGPLEQLLKNQKGDNQTRSLFNTAYKNAEHLLRLVNQLMDFRKLETDHNQLRCTEDNIILFIYEIFISFQEQAKIRNIDYNFLCEQKEIMLWFDHDKVEKIFYNLISNAFKFTPDNHSISLHLKANQESSPGFSDGMFVISVQDTGIGISKNGLNKIFSRFYQMEESNYNQQGSSGLGLAIAKGFVELHQGVIEVESIKNGGSKFIVQLPLGTTHLGLQQIIKDHKSSESQSHYSEAELETVIAKVENPMASLKNIDGEKKPLILIVEDNLDVLMYIKMIFNAKYRIITAHNGEDGYEKAIKLFPDLIISDVMMPKMNGIELCSKIKLEINTSHIPIILLSARTSLIFKVSGLETGADDYIGKPFTQKVLELKVHNLIESRKKLRERFANEFNLSPKEFAVTSADERFLERIINCIEKNMKDPNFGIEFLSREIKMTRGHLYRKIKILTDKTAVEFVRSIRLRNAATLLKTSNLNVNETCYEIGFQDPNYYRKCFKKMYGVSPSEYRKNPNYIPNNQPHANGK